MEKNEEKNKDGTEPKKENASHTRFVECITNHRPLNCRCIVFPTRLREEDLLKPRAHAGRQSGRIDKRIDENGKIDVFMERDVRSGTRFEDSRDTYPERLVKKSCQAYKQHQKLSLPLIMAMKDEWEPKDVKKLYVRDNAGLETALRKVRALNDYWANGSVWKVPSETVQLANKSGESLAAGDVVVSPPITGTKIPPNTRDAFRPQEVTEATASVSSPIVDDSRYPHACPYCGKPSYNDTFLGGVDCSNNCKG